MLWKVKIRLRQKLALGGIFSVTVVIMVFAIIRVVVVSSFSQTLDQTWLYTWSSVEQAVCTYPFPPRPFSLSAIKYILTSQKAIMVACLASFRALFTKSKRPPHQQRISDEETKVDSSASSRWLHLFNKTFGKPSIFTKSSSKWSRDGGGIGLRSIPPLAHGNHRTLISAAKNPWQHHSEPSYGSGEHILSSDRVHVKQEIDMA